MMYKNYKNQKGITLIALVVTIVVLIVLATISINTVLGDNGIIGRAQKAKSSYQNSSASEDESMRQLANEIAKYGGTKTTEPVEMIDKNKSYVSYYADIDGDGIADGIIYADLIESESEQWGGSDGTFSFEAITGVKDYYISKKDYQGEFGTRDMLRASGNGKDRFYVMALEYVNPGESYSWYKLACGSGIPNYNDIVSDKFGTGKANTTAMLKEWNNGTYGVKEDNDMWGIIQDEVSKGWFIPSREEWAAFANNLAVYSENYEVKCLLEKYWSSSIIANRGAYYISFTDNDILSDQIDSSYYVRLSITF